MQDLLYNLTKLRFLILVAGLTLAPPGRHLLHRGEAAAAVEARGHPGLGGQAEWSSLIGPQTSSY